MTKDKKVTERSLKNINIIPKSVFVSNSKISLNSKSEINVSRHSTSNLKDALKPYGSESISGLNDSSNNLNLDTKVVPLTRASIAKNSQVINSTEFKKRSNKRNNSLNFRGIFESGIWIKRLNSVQS